MTTEVSVCCYEALHDSNCPFEEREKRTLVFVNINWKWGCVILEVRVRTRGNGSDKCRYSTSLKRKVATNSVWDDFNDGVLKPRPWYLSTFLYFPLLNKEGLKDNGITSCSFHHAALKDFSHLLYFICSPVKNWCLWTVMWREDSEVLSCQEIDWSILKKSILMLLEGRC